MTIPIQIRLNKMKKEIQDIKNILDETEKTQMLCVI